MGSKKQRSPQEDKALSYARDRRNVYRENDKASRKLISLRKAQENREVRRKVAQELSGLPRLDEEAAAVAESSARQDVHRVGGWRKTADGPLGDIVASALESRGSRARPAD